MDEKPTAREKLYKEIQSNAGDSEFTGAPEDALLVGFLVVAEWEAPEGDRWISKMSGDAFRDLPPWRERGYASEVIFGIGWNENDDD